MIPIPKSIYIKRVYGIQKINLVFVIVSCMSFCELVFWTTFYVHPKVHKRGFSFYYFYSTNRLNYWLLLVIHECRSEREVTIIPQFKLNERCWHKYASNYAEKFEPKGFPKQKYQTSSKNNKYKICYTFWFMTVNMRMQKRDKSIYVWFYLLYFCVLLQRKPSRFKRVVGYVVIVTVYFARTIWKTIFKSHTFIHLIFLWYFGEHRAIDMYLWNLCSTHKHTSKSQLSSKSTLEK